MFKDGLDQGYKDNQNWWEDPADKDRYRYSNTDVDYPKDYFPLADPHNAFHFVQAVMEYYQKITGSKLKNAVEFGTGGGWYMAEFMARNVAIRGYEGSAFGVAECMLKGITGNVVDVVDFRYPIDHTKHSRYQLAICTEVAEHIEPPFHGTLAMNLVHHSSLIWFSSEPPNTNKPHLHHPGEKPLEYWKALFKFLGYGCHMLPDEIHLATNERGRCIFFNRKHYNLP